MKKSSLGEKILALNILEHEEKLEQPNYEHPVEFVSEPAPIEAQDAVEPEVIYPDGPDAA